MPLELAGRFELQAIAGAGASGQVYRALDLCSGDSVALKLIDLVTDNTRIRFEREAAALARLDHPAVVRYVDHGELSYDRCYLAMEWLEGRDLRSVGLRRRFVRELLGRWLLLLGAVRLFELLG